MSKSKNVQYDVYGKDYFENYIPGIPYVKNEHWEKFFGSIADKIKTEINPKTVLDVGCAKGFLVEELRKSGIDAYGIDVSEYGISQVDDSIKDFCKVGSILEKFDKKYDLIICIEVVEHLFEEDSKKAIKNLCKYSNDIIFSSTPIDFEEKTHHNVQNPSYWAKLFEKSGFIKDTKFDATIITSWAGRFRKKTKSKEEIIADYEDKIWELNTEKESLKDLEFYKKEFEKSKEKQKTVIEETQKESRKYFQLQFTPIKEKMEELEAKNQEISSVKEKLEGELEAKNQKISSLKGKMEEGLEKKEDDNWRLQDDLAKAQSELASIKSSPAWKIMPTLVNKLNRYFPNGSKRRDIFDRLVTRKLIQGANQASMSKKGISGTPERNIENDAYNLWIKLNEPTEEELKEQKEIAKKFDFRPLISIITPTFETPKEFLEQLFQSLLDQTYENWELCIADGNSNKKTKKNLQEVSAKDKRIKIKFLEQNLHISGNSNEALKIANGEFVGLLDHDDTLSKDCLFEIVKCMNENRDIDFIYTDKDMITFDGKKRFNPLLKPKWSPEILLSANYLTHFNVMRKSLVDKVGGLRKETDGAQDWDLFFRITEKTDKIKHIPKILYHWRESQTSVSSGIQAKPYVTKSQQITLEQHLERIGTKAKVIFDEYSYPNYDWAVKENSISILIPFVNSLDENILSEIMEKTNYAKFEILLITNQDVKIDLKKFPENLKIVKIKDANGYFLMCLKAIEKANGDYIVFYNTDLKLETPGWLNEVNGLFSIDGIAAVSGMIHNSENEVLHSGKIIAPEGIAFNLHYKVPKRYWGVLGSVSWYRNCLAVTDSFFAVKRDLLEKIDYQKIKSVEELTIKLHGLGNRIVTSPNITFLSNNEKEGQVISNFQSTSFDFLRKDIDPYFNQNISFDESIPILNIHERIDLSHILERKISDKKKNISKNKEMIDSDYILGKYQQDALYLVNRFDFNSKELELSKKIQNLEKIQLKSVAWFLPDFNNAFFGGVNTILRFASFLKQKGVNSYFVIVDISDKEKIGNLVKSAFPNLNDEEIIVFKSPNDLKKIPAVDATVCSLWTSAYYSLKFNNTKRKFYFIQDFEPQFYPAGSTMAQVEATYRFGFYGIANTRTLKEIYQKEFNGVVESFDPAVDSSVFYPPKSKMKNDDVITIFIYGRPDHPRNAFELSINILKKIKEKYGKKVRIISAGAEWNPQDLGLDGIIENLGILDYKETGELFRNSDIGLIMMYTKHPSYIPLELMACKCLVVSNYNPATSWLLKDEENCLLAEPSVSSFFEKLCLSIDNENLRLDLANNALKYVKKYSDWTPQFEKIFTFMQEPKTT